MKKFLLSVLIIVAVIIVSGCGNGAISCKDSPAYAPAWVYETTYWLGSAMNDLTTWFIFEGGQFGNYYNNDSCYGVCPVIVI